MFQFLLIIVMFALAPAHAADKAWRDCVQSKDADRSIDGCSKVLARGGRESVKNRANAFYDRGNSYYSKGDYDAAIGDYDKAIALDSRHIKAYNNRGNAYRAKGSIDNAIADHDKVLSLDSKFLLGYLSRGDDYRAKENCDLAISSYSQAIHLGARNFLAYAMRGACYSQKGDYVQAIKDLDSALRLEPGSLTVMQLRQLAQMALEQKSREENAADTAVPSPPTVRIMETRVALVIGNARYEAQALLRNPHNDATAVAAALRADGFKSITVAENLSRGDLVRALQNFQDEADHADWAVIYFSGHGLEIGGVNYVVPIDAKLKTDRNAADEAVTLNRLMDSVGGAKKLKIVILDACRENPFAHAMQRTVAFKSADKGLNPVEPTPGTLVFYAARDGQLAQDGQGENSPFAASLARRMVESQVEISKMFRLVTDDVMDATDHHQQPFVYGSLTGKEDFYFRP